MAPERPLPVRPSLNALLAQRTAPRHVRRALADAVVAAVQAHPPRLFPKYVSWALVMTTDPPRPERRKKGTDMSGRVIDENDLSPEERARLAAPTNGLSPEAHELAERRAAKARRGEEQRQKWLEESGFAAVIAKAEGLLAEIPRALEEHRKAQNALQDLGVFLALAAEAPDDHVLQRYARRAQDLARQIATPPLLVENAGHLRDFIARVRSADLGDANGPVRNGNVATAWRRRFTELVSPLPGHGHAAACAAQVKTLMAEARDARAGRTA